MTETSEFSYHKLGGHIRICVTNIANKSEFSYHKYRGHIWIFVP